jgi:hypothetical protein
MDDELLGRRSAREEARSLYLMLGQDGNTAESLRELIAVPQRIERVLRAYAARPVYSRGRDFLRLLSSLLVYADDGPERVGGCRVLWID